MDSEVIQGWKTQWTGGHTFIIVEHHKETDAILTLESNKGFGLNGVALGKLAWLETLAINLRRTGGRERVSKLRSR